MATREELSIQQILRIIAGDITGVGLDIGAGLLKLFADSGNITGTGTAKISMLGGFEVGSLFDIDSNGEITKVGNEAADAFGLRVRRFIVTESDLTAAGTGPEQEILGPLSSSKAAIVLDALAYTTATWTASGPSLSALRLDVGKTGDPNAFIDGVASSNDIKTAGAYYGDTVAEKGTDLSTVNTALVPANDDILAEFNRNAGNLADILTGAVDIYILHILLPTPSP